MNKFITLILCLCCIFTSAWAEGDDHVSLNPSDANIVGHILDKKTGEHLSFINVYLHGTTIGTTTDATGHYSNKNRHKAQRKAKFYINKCRSASCMQSGWKRTPA